MSDSKLVVCEKWKQDVFKTGIPADMTRDVCVVREIGLALLIELIIELRGLSIPEIKEKMKKEKKYDILCRFFVEEKVEEE